MFLHELLSSNDRLSNYLPKFDVKPNSAQKVKGRETKETDRQREKKRKKHTVTTVYREKREREFRLVSDRISANLKELNTKLSNKMAF